MSTKISDIQPGQRFTVENAKTIWRLDDSEHAILALATYCDKEKRIACINDKGIRRYYYRWLIAHVVGENQSYLNALLSYLNTNRHVTNLIIRPPVFVITKTGLMPDEINKWIVSARQPVQIALNVEKATNEYIQSLKSMTERYTVFTILFASEHREDDERMKSLKSRCAVFDLTR